MTKIRLGALILMVGSLASFGCGGDGMPSPDNGMSDPDVGVLDEGVLDEGVDSGPDGLANGASCEAPAECLSGSCVDGVCCDTACAGTCMACTAARTGGTDGTCAPVPSETDPDEECDAGPCTYGTCDGAGACDAYPDGYVCRATAGDCDVEETCSAGVCPADLVSSEGTMCRDSVGLCDVAEACSGSSTQCPADGFASSATSVAACSPYLCSGTSSACSTSCTSDTDCAFGYFCVPGVTTNTCVPGRLMFVTSTVHDGNLGGLSGADAICQARATAAGRTGYFRAWLSSGTVSASQRIQHYTGPFYRLTATGTLRVASNWTDLTNGLDTAAIATDEYGVSAGSGTYAWTGTEPWGATDTSNARCLDWTSASAAQSATRGWTSAGSSDWSSNGTAVCSSTLRLYCVETTPPG